ncbi:MAG: AIR synthase-related protein, partial [Eubacteriales bacterium]|nr:AIR synthase-related protein [Eubacteriales bacterium]
ILALPSSGIHSNGFSLVRRIFDVENQPLTTHINELGTTLGEALLTPTKIYVKPVLALLEKLEVNAISHITGGGFYENIPRALPKGYSARIRRESLRIPPVFHLMQKIGNIPEREMFNVFNMGTGMCIVIASQDADKAIRLLKEQGEEALIVGEIIPGDNEVIIC